MSADLCVVGLGRMRYGEALELQRTLAHERISGAQPRDMLLLVEHAPVITLGRSFKSEHMPTSRSSLERKGVELFEIERGGDVTYHGPGQLVGYPILNLAEHRQDLHWYLRQIEEVLIRGLGELGISAGRNQPHTGVWIDPVRKIASIGIHVKEWVTWHGFALNVTTDLSYFDLIVPCGIPDVRMTSIQRELGGRAPRDLWSRTIENVVMGFSEVFGQTPQMVPVEEVIPPRTGGTVRTL